MLPADPMFPSQPFLNRPRVISLLLATWYIIIACWHYPGAVAFKVAIQTLVLLMLIWFPFELNHYRSLGRSPVNRHEANALDAIFRFLLWTLFLARIPWFIMTWSVTSWPKSWLPQEAPPPIHFFSS